MGKDIESILKTFSTVPEFGDAGDYADWHQSNLDSVWEYYSCSKRHNYHEVTQYIINNFNSPKDSEAISVITENLQSLIDYIKSNWECSYEKLPYDCGTLDAPFFDCDKNKTLSGTSHTCHDYKLLYRSLIKLYDHIQLEFIRLSAILNKNQEIQLSYNKINEKFTEVNDKYIKNEETQKNLMSELEIKTRSFDDVSDKLGQEVKGIYMQIVSILGIFAAIVLAFMGGMSFTASTFQGIALTSFYRVAIITLICGFVVFNTISVLLYIVSKIVNIPLAEKCKTEDCSCENKCMSPTRLRKKFPLIFWINIIFIVMLAINVICWMIDLNSFAIFIRDWLY